MQKKFFAIAFSIAFFLFSSIGAPFGGTALASPTHETFANNDVAIATAQVVDTSTTSSAFAECPRTCPGGTALCHDNAGKFCSCCSLEIWLIDAPIELEETESTTATADSVEIPVAVPQATSTVETAGPTELQPQVVEVSNPIASQPQNAPMSVFASATTTLPKSLQVTPSPFPGPPQASCTLCMLNCSPGFHCCVQPGGSCICAVGC